MSRIVLLFSTLLAAFNAAAHPGHPTLVPNHTHETLEIDPLLAVAFFVMTALLAGRAIYRRAREKQ